MHPNHGGEESPERRGWGCNSDVERGVVKLDFLVTSGGVEGGRLRECAATELDNRARSITIVSKQHKQVCLFDLLHPPAFDQRTLQSTTIATTHTNININSPASSQPEFPRLYPTEHVAAVVLFKLLCLFRPLSRFTVRK